MKVFVLILKENINWPIVTIKRTHHDITRTYEAIESVEYYETLDSLLSHTVLTTQICALSTLLLQEDWRVFIVDKNYFAHKIEFGMPLADGSKLKTSDDIRKILLLGKFGDWV